MVFRFEYFENVISKHHLNKIDWTQSANWAFLTNTSGNDWTIARVRQIDEDQVEIIKRKD